MSAVANQTGKPEDEAAARGRALYEYGPTSIYASRHDPRFPYCLYVPPNLGQTGEKPELIVAMHGTGRGFTGYRDAFSAFARWHNCVILAPLFPIGVMGDGYRDGFKYMREGDLRYDHLLLAIVDEISERYRLSFERFGLFGYSGGGHFAHRFLLLQPHRLWGVSIGAPGSVTLLDPTRDWWVGTRNIGELFGQEPDIAAMRQVAVQMVVGAADLETWEITHRPGGRNWMPDANHAGRNRPERLAALRDSFTQNGISVRFDLVPNTPHDGLKVVPTVEDFFAAELAKLRGARKAA
ncbi:alpha/beta hydrolase [Bosea minatitlanensis]|uniref:Alpha/beta hydrolase n=1 Tax=Bosea minatitlanensis TaxID=128782 RepID=A0ABW0F5U9_9HYPH|nr:alpha/beta hydrolase [Bosea minatitlanensis]MCT4493558.1 alpha/beta hydrolase [Bosea minatitlanensis]